MIARRTPIRVATETLVDCKETRSVLQRMRAAMSPSAPSRRPTAPCVARPSDRAIRLKRVMDCQSRVQKMC